MSRTSPYRPRPPIIAIGASAGGIKAILALLNELPSDLAAVVLLVVHRSPHQPSLLPEVISRQSPIYVHLARDGMALDKPICLVAPPDRHMTVTSGLKIHLVADGYYRANNIDLLFHSLARSAGSRAIGVILSGLLKDGAEGLRAIKEAGGAALVQSPAEAEYPDMPKNAISFDGPIDFVGPLAALAREICRRVEGVPLEKELP